jgi:FMN-dependent oxidoreductase (nitrilotriacetate monooxygenase family)
MPEAIKGTETTFEIYRDVTLRAERAKMDAMFFADTACVPTVDLIEKGDPTAGMFPQIRNIEPMSLLPALAAVTKNIGLIATGTTTYNDPYTIARRFSALDQISGGRGGWNVVTSQFAAEAQNFGFDSHMEHDERYKRAGEFFDVTVGLWDGWTADAVMEDKEAAMYFDTSKVRVLNHKGEYFKVRGPLNQARSPQGRPIIAQAGASGPGRKLAARIGDLVFSAQSELAEAKIFYDDIKSLAGSFGRSPQDLKVLPGIMPIIGKTESEAKEHYLRLQSLITDDQALRALHRLSGGLDLAKYPLDGPLPELPRTNDAQARQQRLIDIAKRDNLSIRQVGRLFAESRSHHLVWGTPEKIADDMQHWFETVACDGFCIIFPYYPRGVTDFLETVVPELQRRGVFRTEYRGKTLRENLGLRMPHSQFDVA